jgi:hypothetical protein
MTGSSTAREYAASSMAGTIFIQTPQEGKRLERAGNSAALSLRVLIVQET